jgi:hypothetical protein
MLMQTGATLWFSINSGSSFESRWGRQMFRMILPTRPRVRRLSKIGTVAVRRDGREPCATAFEIKPGEVLSAACSTTSRRGARHGSALDRSHRAVRLPTLLLARHERGDRRPTNLRPPSDREPNAPSRYEGLAASA